MGCAGSSQSKADGTVKKIRKPKPWKHPQPLTKSQLMQLRDEFWDTAPHYGGRKDKYSGMACSCTMWFYGYSMRTDVVDSKRFARILGRPKKITNDMFFGSLEIWDALRAAAEADIALAQAIVDSAGVIIQNADLTICYDERGAKYELPKYVLSEPTNLIREG
ncbi:hypothetical protein EZV62_007977 [Acer yangbiense]|uniref:DC-UbP/UBTD2 N-terminal domain-containing protein n=1 Tax=Acer yangbiense TaxID=1000413 RepID=A0A5C7ICX9_9ROSI|nr:hypothetical protein EZV62_007977 [Acer yangbiense]